MRASHTAADMVGARPRSSAAVVTMSFVAGVKSYGQALLKSVEQTDSPGLVVSFVHRSPIKRCLGDKTNKGLAGISMAFDCDQLCLTEFHLCPSTSGEKLAPLISRKDDSCSHRDNAGRRHSHGFGWRQSRMKTETLFPTPSLLSNCPDSIGSLRSSVCQHLPPGEEHS